MGRGQLSGDQELITDYYFVQSVSITSLVQNFMTSLCLLSTSEIYANNLIIPLSKQISLNYFDLVFKMSFFLDWKVKAVYGKY